MFFFILFLFSIHCFKLKFNDDFTISGISSGGYMASQVHISHSTIFRGVALFAAGPYYCAEGSVERALTHCSNLQKKGTKKLDFDNLINNMLEIEKSGLIDPLSVLRNQKVYLFRGTKDWKVPENITHFNERVYGYFGSNMLLRDDIPAGHAFPTEDWGTLCGDYSETPFIQNCKFDAAREVFKFFYNIRTGHIRNQHDHHMYRFKQVSRTKESDFLGVAKEGFLYIPQNCHQGKACSVHFALHGCQQNFETIGYSFIKKTGFNRWAEDNDVIIVYPQTKNTELNPHGCWDWWGLFGEEDYMTKNGRQVKWIRNLIKEIPKMVFDDHYFQEEMEAKGLKPIIHDDDENIYAEL